MTDRDVIALLTEYRLAVVLDGYNAMAMMLSGRPHNHSGDWTACQMCTSLADLSAPGWVHALVMVRGPIYGWASICAFRLFVLTVHADKLTRDALDSLWRLDEEAALKMAKERWWQFRKRETNAAKRRKRRKY